MADTKYGIFYSNICSAVTSSVYEGWEQEDLNSLSNSERTIYYDSNIAFTDGSKSIVSNPDGDGSLLAVPDLYGTLKGLNTRISNVNDRITETQASNVSTADARLYVGDATSEYIISAGNGAYQEGGSHIIAESAMNKNISLQGSAAKFTVNGDDFAFTVGNTTLTLTDILMMIEELRARTATISTSEVRAEVNASSPPVLTTNIITQS